MHLLLHQENVLLKGLNQIRLVNCGKKKKALLITIFIRILIISWHILINRP